MTDRVNPLSRDWATISDHCHQRIRDLSAELVELGHEHTESLDAARRHRIDELRLVLALVSPPSTPR